MTAAAFAEVIGSPYTAYVGAVGAAAPALDALESSFSPTTWFKLGTNGINNQGSAGVTVNLGRTMTKFTPQGGTLVVKQWTTDEDITVQGSLVDTSIEQFAKILDDATITTVAAGTGNAGKKKIDLVRGINVHYYALLVRGISPYDDGSGTFVAQYAFSRVSQSAAQAPKYLKGTPAELAWEFTINGDVAGNDPAFYEAQNALHL